AGMGKSSAPAAFCRERGGHDEGAKGRRCRPVFFPVQPVIAAGDCRDFLCALLGESTLAVEVGSVVSASHSALPCVASNRGRGSIAGDQRLGTSRARSTLSRCRMVLVSREPGADDWVGAGGRSGHGGPIRLHSVHRFVCHGNMAGGRLVELRESFCRVAGHSSSLLSAGTGNADLSSGSLLARHGIILAPHAGPDGEQLVCARYPGRISE